MKKTAFLCLVLCLAACGKQVWVTGRIVDKTYEAAHTDVSIGTDFDGNPTLQTRSYPESCSVKVEYGGNIYWRNVPCGAAFETYEAGDQIDITVPEGDVVSKP